MSVMVEGRWVLRASRAVQKESLPSSCKMLRSQGNRSSGLTRAVIVRNIYINACSVSVDCPFLSFPALVPRSTCSHEVDPVHPTQYSHGKIWQHYTVLARLHGFTHSLKRACTHAHTA